MDVVPHNIQTQLQTTLMLCVTNLYYGSKPVQMSSTRSAVGAGVL